MDRRKRWKSVVQYHGILLCGRCTGALRAETMKRHGCYNRKPLSSVLAVQNGWTEHGRLMRLIHNVNSRDCVYQRSTADAACDGCSWNERSRKEGDSKHPGAVAT